MLKYFLMAIAVVVGMGIPLQGAINAQMGKALQNPLMGTFVSFTGGLTAIGLILLCTTPGIPAWVAPRSTPWYLYCGGLPGVVFVTTTLLLFPRIGATNALAGFLVGQFLASLAFDHFGWLGVQERPISFLRVIGVCLLIAGMLLVAKGDRVVASDNAAPADQAQGDDAIATQPDEAS